MTPLRLATTDELTTVLALLQNSGLPYQDVDTTRPIEFLVAATGQSLPGAIGLERLDSNGLLRSLVVRSQRRKSRRFKKEARKSATRQSLQSLRPELGYLAAVPVSTAAVAFHIRNDHVSYHCSRRR
jgi:hypothetical protein